jgi:hypothetical protein
VWRTMGTLQIDALLMQADTFRIMPATLQAAGCLLAIGVVLRSAQLPFHGWLIQVMEAPTPVSALLHAGIVNIGGFVLIRLAGLVGRLEGAQTLLVVVGATTAVLAALVMTTRVSVKVALAWSTCAQMGFMLLECGLGAYGLALLHLVAHSLYKAHGFLASGRTVEQQVLRRIAPEPTRPTALRWTIAASFAMLTVVLLLTVGSILARPAPRGRRRDRCALRAPAWYGRNRARDNVCGGPRPLRRRYFCGSRRRPVRCRAPRLCRRRLSAAVRCTRDDHRAPHGPVRARDLPSLLRGLLPGRTVHAPDISHLAARHDAHTDRRPCDAPAT